MTAELIDTGLVRTAVEIKNLPEATCDICDNPLTHHITHATCHINVCQPHAQHVTNERQAAITERTPMVCTRCATIPIHPRTVHIYPI